VTNDYEYVQDLTEILFTIYDSIATLSGGTETGVEAELSLFKQLAERLSSRLTWLKPAPGRIAVADKYIEAVHKGDGQMAHFYSRMIFSGVRSEILNCFKEMH
jgi:hypothetical protein